MKVSYDWLQSYFDEQLPSADKIAEILTFHAFEIEGVEQKGRDTIIDVGVLPNRSSDCLSHRGIARELATLLGLKLKDDLLKRPATSSPDSNFLEVDVQSPKLVNRFSVAVVSNVEVGPSPEWLKKRLEAIGQKSINNIVDATNYVMFDIGQPLHAFDRDKLTERDGGYTISVRTGKVGEEITTLTGDAYELNDKNLLIVDGNADQPIGIAGVKGGKRAEVQRGTKNLVIEAANFNYVSARKTSQALKLWTDASVRFQNQPSPELTLHALREVIKLIGGEVEGFVDYYPNPKEAQPVSVTVSEINSLLGTDFAVSDVDDILKRFEFAFERSGEQFTVTPPFERTDLKIKEDLIEEVGRVYGYEHIVSAPLSEPEEKPPVNKRFYYAEEIRQLLIEQGFSEVYTYSLRDKGEIELANPVAKDRPFMRSNLTDGLRESLKLNARNVDLLGLEDVRIFEIGTVFAKDSEYTALALGVSGTKDAKMQEILVKAREHLASGLGTELPNTDTRDGVWEINFDEMVGHLSQSEHYDDAFMIYHKGRNKKFRPISAYPFVLRDLAVWVHAQTSSEEVLDAVRKEAGELLAKSRLFDTYDKDGRISYAFRLAFQSHEKTLSDEEVNKVMEKITTALEERGWEVR